MTSPLPAQNSKPVLGESKNLQQGGFLNFSALPKSKEMQSFEALIDQNDQRRERQDEIEEAEASKKRRKALDAAAVAPQIQTNTGLQSEACLEPSLDFAQLHNVNQDILAKQNSSAVQFPSSEKRTDSTAIPNPPAESDTHSAREAAITETFSAKTETQKGADAELPLDDSTFQNAQSQAEETVQIDASALEEFKDSSSGTESATKEDEMVSLATFEEFQSSAAPKAVGEPSITSTNRLSTMASISERTAISSIENVDSEENSFSGNFSAGNPSLIPIQGDVSFQKRAASQASSLLKSLAPELKKFQQTGQSQIQLELPVGDNESVKIRLSLRAGEIRSTFITESPELREALQKAWPDFTATHRAQGIRFGDSQFQDSFTRNQDAASEQGRQRQNQQEALSADLPSKQQAKSILRPTSQGLPNQKSSSSSLNLWA